MFGPLKEAGYASAIVVSDPEFSKSRRTRCFSAASNFASPTSARRDLVSLAIGGLKECSSVMSRMALKAILHRFLILDGLWLVLTGMELKGLAVGAIAVPAATWLSLRLLPGLQQLSLWRVARHIPSFVAGSVLGGFDVARRALSPRMPLRPGWLEVPVRLSDGGRVAMGGELSLMPGTLAAGIRRDRLLVHLLDTEAGFERAIPREEAAIAAMMRGDVSPEHGV